MGFFGVLAKGTVDFLNPTYNPLDLSERGQRDTEKGSENSRIKNIYFKQGEKRSPGSPRHKGLFANSDPSGQVTIRIEKASEMRKPGEKGPPDEKEPVPVSPKEEGAKSPFESEQEEELSPRGEQTVANHSEQKPSDSVHHSSSPKPSEESVAEGTENGVGSSVLSDKKRLGTPNGERLTTFGRVWEVLSLKGWEKGLGLCKLVFHIVNFALLFLPTLAIYLVSAACDYCSLGGRVNKEDS